MAQKRNKIIMPTIIVPTIKLTKDDYARVIRLKPKLEMERGHFISLTDLVREALRELAKLNGVEVN